MSHENPTDRRYTKDHEWAKTENGKVLVGITQYAVDQLGDITLVNIDLKPGDTITEGKAFGTIESVKTLSDLFAPISGTVARINQTLENQPELINDDCLTKGWMIELTPASADSLNTLLDAAAYNELLKSVSH